MSVQAEDAADGYLSYADDLLGCLIPAAMVTNGDPHQLYIKSENIDFMEEENDAFVKSCMMQSQLNGAAGDGGIVIPPALKDLDPADTTPVSVQQEVSQSEVPEIHTLTPSLPHPISEQIILPIQQEQFNSMTTWLDQATETQSLPIPSVLKCCLCDAVLSPAAQTPAPGDVKATCVQCRRLHNQPPVTTTQALTRLPASLLQSTAPSIAHAPAPKVTVVPPLQPQPRPTLSPPCELKCNECGEVFSRPLTLRVHMRTHTGERPYKCTECDKAYAHANNLRSHLLTHKGQKPYKKHRCLVCGQAYTQASNLKFHMLQHEQNQYPCTNCRQVFDSQEELDEHFLEHVKEKSHKCPRCGKSFKDTTRLKRHERTHTEERKFKCEACTKAFMNKSDLFRHLRIHTGEKPFKCGGCGQAYSMKQSLVRHQALSKSCSGIFVQKKDHADEPKSGESDSSNSGDNDLSVGCGDVTPMECQSSLANIESLAAASRGATHLARDVTVSNMSHVISALKKGPLQSPV